MTQTNFNKLPAKAGIGLRSQHYAYILEHQPNVPWLEILTENYMGNGGLPLYFLEKIRQLYPIAFHGVGMSLASADPLDISYMKKLKQMISRYQPVHVSDHLSWISINNHHLHELLPFPYNNETLKHLQTKISQAQDYLGQELVIENPSSYMSFQDTDINEWDFINQLCSTTGCKLLLDVNNVFVSAYNTDIDAQRYINAINKSHIAEVHLAGFENRKSHLYDTHGSRVDNAVWDLYKLLIQQTGPIPSLVEWDNDIPEFHVLLEESHKAQNIINAYGEDYVRAS